MERHPLNNLFQLIFANEKTKNNKELNEIRIKTGGHVRSDEIDGGIEDWRFAHGKFIVVGILTPY